MVLVSYTNEANVVFKELNKLESEKDNAYPQMSVIKPNITLINPTDALLRSEYS